MPSPFVGTGANGTSQQHLFGVEIDGGIFVTMTEEWEGSGCQGSMDENSPNSYRFT